MNKAALQSHNVIFSNNFLTKHLTRKGSNIILPSTCLNKVYNLCKVVHNFVIDNGA